MNRWKYLEGKKHLKKAKRETKITQAKDVTELVSHVFDEHAVLLGVNPNILIENNGEC